MATFPPASSRCCPTCQPRSAEDLRSCPVASDQLLLEPRHLANFARYLILGPYRGRDSSRVAASRLGRLESPLDPVPEVVARRSPCAARVRRCCQISGGPRAGPARDRPCGCTRMQNGEYVRGRKDLSSRERKISWASSFPSKVTRSPPCTLLCRNEAMRWAARDKRREAV